MVLVSKSVTVSGLALLLGLAGCSTLPRAGPDERAIESSAAIKVGYGQGDAKKVGLDYVLVDMNRQLLPFFQTAPRSSISEGFGGRGGAPDTVIGVGDIVQVSIFESSSGGLFIPSDAGSRPGNYITLPSQTVDSSGTISVPYAGRIRVVGRTPQAVQGEIDNTLANRAIEPQSLVTIMENRSRQVAVLGDVNLPAKLDINPAGERVLDVIARAGGLATPGVETYITMQRRGREATVLFSDLIKNAKENVFVAPGDTIYVNRERRTYLAFGAAGLNGRIDFEESNLTLGEALGKAGGLLDGRADPAQVFLYREVDRSTLRQMNVDVSRYKGDRIPVIFRANLRDPAMFFVVQRFPMSDKDIIYVSNSDSTEVSKFLSIITQVTGSASTVASDVTVTRRGF
ncbi:sugar ABC transporter substrate-binding protein [Aureimonas endophytica]|uniref:Sugar ABC transporter substrate-binding protein n=1 Tax=Aureimonas endophytica TaxID=2027858 RepID=A0A917E428_9HYPH|nr:polysaccharide biosynthesis/export family protein [Aureimonas endophytica]GGE00987.1 sugar ABC transporter substrate-binding protein [Aureimonas endophytica]